jgi:predicted dehydrogenase
VIRHVLEGTGDQAVIHSICDPDARSIKAAREKLGDSFVVKDTYQELVSDPEVDWVFIGSWNCYHREQAIAAFEAGKHVFCEKPLGISLEDCVAMKAAWEKSGCKFVIGFTLRYSPFYRKLKDLISSGEIGDLNSMEFNETLDFNHGGYIHGDWRRKTEFAGTHLLEKCCHDLDLVNWLTESRASRVASFGGTDFFIPENVGEIERVGKNPEGKEAFRTWAGLISENPFTSDKDIVDNQVAIIEYENKVRATFHTNACAAICERRMYLCGTRGTIRADVLTGEIELRKIGFGTEVKKIDAGVKGLHGGGDAVLGKEVADYMLHDTPPASTLEAGMLAAITAFGIDQSMETGLMVDMNDLWNKAGL